MKKSLTFILIFIFLNLSLIYGESKRIYIFKNQKGQFVFSNIAPLTFNKRLTNIKIIRINNKYNVVKFQKAYDYKKKIDYLLKVAAQKYNIDYTLLKAVAKIESDCNHSIVSHKGAIGVMQLMPETAERFGVKNIYDLKENIFGGARYLKYLLKKFNNNKLLAVAAYNAGENSVVKYSGIPPYPETRRYVRKVFSLYKNYLKNEKIF